MRRLVGWLGVVCAVLGLGAAWLAGATPSHSRTWGPGQEMLPLISFADGTVHIRNIRDFTYRSEDDFTAGYREGTYQLDELERVWFVLSPFGRDWRGPAHIFLTFGFSDGL